MRELLGAGVGAFARFAEFGGCSPRKKLIGFTLLTSLITGVAAGFALGLRIDAGGDYWTTVLPPILAVSAGMAIAVAPLTTAVLGAVDEHHVGTASGLNSAVSRSGGLIVVALLGAVLSHRGPALIAALHGAALVGAGLALLSSLTALATLGVARVRPSPGTG